MANYYLTIEAHGNTVTVKSLISTATNNVATAATDASALALLDFLQSAAQVFLDTQHLPLEQALAHVRGLTLTHH